MLDLDPTGPDPDDQSVQPVASMRLGEYELGAELGRGAMGVVYRARQPRLRREVAVKVLLASRFAGESARKRFLAEAELAAQLDHPNIVPIYEVGETSNGPFYVMKLVEGGTLAGRTSNAEGRRPNDGAGRSHRELVIRHSSFVISKVARAVHHAHQRGVLHRDLKPGNILIDAQGEPHVTDFGLARQLGADSSLTLTGSTLGTPAYMSPEQARGEKTVTTAADVWSLGAILYHLIAGRPPFAGHTAMEVLRKVMEEEPMPPGRPTVDDLRWTSGRPGIRANRKSRIVSPDLETICLKCLEKDPARRYDSALALAEDLERWLRDEPIRARASRPTERVIKWARRRPAIAALTSLACVLIVVAITGIAWQWRRAEAHRATAEKSQETTQRANADLLTLVNRIEHERAEQFFQAGDSPRAVALLARVLRRDPHNRRAAERMLSALAYRPFAVPEREFAPLGASILAARSDARGMQLAGVYNQTEVRLWDASAGSPVSPRFMRANSPTFPAFTPDGSRVVLATASNAVEILDATNRTRLAGPLRHSSQAGAAITALRFDRAGTRVLTASSDGTAQVWSVPEGVALGKPLAAGRPLRDADLSADGRLAAAVSRDGEVVVWDVHAGRELARHPPDAAPARLVRWSHEGGHLALACGSRRLEWREAFSGRVVRTWQAPEDVLSVTCGQGDATVLAQGATAAFLWDAATGKLAAEPLPRRAGGAGLDLPPGTNQFLTVTHNGVTRSMRRRTGLTAAELLHGPGLATVRFTADGAKLLSSGTNGTVALWEARSLQPLGSPRPLSGTLLASSDDAETVLVASNATAWLAAIRTGERISPIFSEDGPILCGAIRPGGAEVVLGRVNSLGGTNGAVGVWSVARGVRLWYDKYPYKVNGLAYSPDGRRLTVRWGVYVAIIDRDLTVTKHLQHRGFVEQIMFSRDGSQLAVASRNYTTTVWGMSNLVERLHLAHEGPVARVAIGSDAHHLATIALVRQHKVFLWNGTNGQRLGEALSHPGNALDVAFSPDSRRVATASDDGTAQVWDAATGLPLSEPLRHGAAVRSVSFDHVGARLATAGDDGVVRVWELPLVNGVVEPWLPALAEALAGTYFTATEALDLTPWPETAAAFAAVHSAPATDAALWARRIIPSPAVPPER